MLKHLSIEHINNTILVHFNCRSLQFKTMALFLSGMSLNLTAQELESIPTLTGQYCFPMMRRDLKFPP